MWNWEKQSENERFDRKEINSRKEINDRKYVRKKEKVSLNGRKALPKAALLGGVNL